MPYIHIITQEPRKTICGSKCYLSVKNMRQILAGAFYCGTNNYFIATAAFAFATIF